VAYDLLAIIGFSDP